MSAFGVCLVLFFVTGSFARPGQRAVSCSDATKIVAQLAKNHDQAVRAGDVQTAASFYDPKVIMMPNGVATFVGRDVLEPSMTWIKQVGSVTATLNKVSCLGTSRLVIVLKTSKITNKNGDLMFDGKTLQIWRRTSGGYRIYLEMYNSKS